MARAVEQRGKAGCEKWTVKAPFKSKDYKHKMMACKAKAAIKGLQTAAAFIKKSAGGCKDKKCQKGLQAELIDIASEIKNQQSYL